MKTSTIKKLAFLLSFSTLILNTSPLFAQTLLLEVLGGGYKLRGPATVNLTSATTSKNSSLSVLNFANIASTTPNEANRNYIEIIDENGGNPFDVTVSTSSFKRSELLDTNITAGSTISSIKVSSSVGYNVGDNFTIVGTIEGNHTITSIPDANTINVSPSLTNAPTIGQIFRRVVDCDLNSRKCILLENFSIANTDGNTPLVVVNGKAGDVTPNSQTDLQKAFGGRTTTIAGSNGTTLKVADSSVFDAGETINLGSPNATTPEALPSTNIIASIDDINTITLAAPFSTAPSANVTIYSTSSRSLTLASGSGAAPSDTKIWPQLQVTIDAGQISGTYETVLYLSII